MQCNNRVWIRREKKAMDAQLKAQQDLWPECRRDAGTGWKV